MKRPDSLQKTREQPSIVINSMLNHHQEPCTRVDLSLTQIIMTVELLPKWHLEGQFDIQNIIQEYFPVSMDHRTAEWIRWIRSNYWWSQPRVCCRLQILWLSQKSFLGIRPSPRLGMGSILVLGRNCKIWNQDRLNLVKNHRQVQHMGRWDSIRRSHHGQGRNLKCLWMRDWRRWSSIKDWRGSNSRRGRWTNFSISSKGKEGSHSVWLK